MLRALVVGLLLANLAFFAWAQGWLDVVVGVRAGGDREPERLLRQVRPETVRVLPPSGDAAAGATGSAAACLEAGPFGDAEFGRAQAALQAALPGGGWVAVNVDRPGSWIVYMGRYANREALTRKEEELQRRKLPYEELQGNPALVPGLVLGRYDDRAAAAKALDRFAEQGIHTARVVELQPASSAHLLRIEKADAALAARLAALNAEPLMAGFAACASAPGT